MKPSYGRLNRWVLRTSPDHAIKLEGVEDVGNTVTTYRLREDLSGFRGLELIAPLGIEVYQAKDLGMVEKNDVFFATKPEDSADAYLCLISLGFINTKTPRVGVLTSSSWLDANYSSKAFGDLIANGNSKRSIPFPSKKLRVQGLEIQLGFEHRTLASDSDKRIIGYHKLPF